MYRAELAGKLLRREDLGELNGVIRGLESERDPISWRTAVILCRGFFVEKDHLGAFVENPDWVPPSGDNGDAREFVRQLFVERDKRIWLGALEPEFACAVCGVDVAPELALPALDAIVINGRHYPEPLAYRLAEELEGGDGGVAVVNPVGHYGDRETRIISVPELLRPVEDVVVVASTQQEDGGDVGVLSQVLAGVLKNPGFINQVTRVHVVIPMFGGSRSHRLGQDEFVGYEVLQAKEQANTLVDSVKRAFNDLSENGGNRPDVIFYSVDIHNNELPGDVFRDEGIEFVSVLPVREYAEVVDKYLEEQELKKVPLQVVSADRGAVIRSEELVEEMLVSGLTNGNGWLDLVYLKKDRPRAGEVSKVEVDKVVRWHFDNGQIVKEQLEVDSEYWEEERVVVSSDDMFDTVGTQKRMSFLVRGLNPNLKCLLAIGTHGVLSKGANKLDEAGADHFFIGNTMRSNDLEERSDVTIVNVAGAIARAMDGRRVGQ